MPEKTETLEPAILMGIWVVADPAVAVMVAVRFAALVIPE